MTEELELVPATRSPHGFLASQLSDNIFEKDDGTLIVIGCPIARTGFQRYSVKDLPQQRAFDLGVDISNPEASIDLYRPASEVFHSEFLASLNGCPITDGHPPGGEFVDPNNFKKYACGHIQNVRKGSEPLDDGEWPIIADLVISAEPLISKVRNKTARELSLGYDFSIDREGGKIIQCAMAGNHNAVVPDGRAGDFVRIEDAAPLETAAEAVAASPASEPTPVEQVLPVASGQANQKEPEPAKVEVIEAVAYPPIKLSFKSNKEKQPVSTKNKLLRLFMGKHLIEMARATDADPEKIMEAAEALQETPPEAADDKRGKDGEVPPALKEHEFKKSEDRRSRDDDEVVSADRKAAHDALDRIMDKRKAKGRDADVEELRELLDEFLEEEEKEPEHAEDDTDPADLEATLAGEDELCPECGEAHDAGECPDEELVESGEEVMDAEEGESPDPDSDDDQEDVEPAEDRRRVKDRARAADGATAVLRMLRPVVARSGDKAVQSAFNRALDSVKKVSRASAGSYGGFAASARARDKAPRNPNPDRARAGDSGKADPMKTLQEFYDSARKGGK